MHILKIMFLCNTQILNPEAYNSYLRALEASKASQSPPNCEQLTVYDSSFNPTFTYNGQVKAGKKLGYGIMTFSNNDRYEGEWANNQMNGHGVFSEISGSMYHGEFKASKRDGYGVSTLPDGCTVKAGQWVKGKFIE